MTLAGSAGYISGDITVDVNSAIKFGITARATSGTVKRCYIYRTITGKPAQKVLDTTFTAAITVFATDINTTALGAAGTEKWDFTVTDSNGGSATVSVTITTTVPTTYGPIFSYPTKVLGAQTSATGSSFASSNGTVYSLADAKINSALIDWVYFYGATNFATICAPNDADAAAVFNNATNGVATWATRNATVFKTATGIGNWNSITNDSTILAQTSSGVTGSKVNNLATGYFLAFITATGKKGLIKVNSLTPDATGSIDIDVKVQQ